MLKKHRYRKQKKTFDGNTEEKIAARILTGDDVFEMVKDVKVVLRNRKPKDPVVYEP